MTDLVIPCSTFMRLQHVAIQPGEWSGEREWMRCVRLEAKGGHLLAMTTCGNLMAVERIPVMSAVSDVATSIAVSPEMLAFVERGAQADDNLIVTPAPGWTVARLAGGAMFNNNAEQPGEWPDWRALLPDELPKKALGVMTFNGEHISRIAKSSPSGVFACPKFVDPVMPVVVRDVNDPNWIGIFKVNRQETPDSFEPATIPAWVR